VPKGAGAGLVCATLLAMGLGLLAGAVPVQGQTPTRPEVVSISFEGNRTFRDQMLRNAIVTRQTSCTFVVLKPFCWADRDFSLDRAFLTPRIFELDYARVVIFYRQAGFRQVQVDTVIERRTDTRIDVTYRIEEGEPIRVRELGVSGLEGLDSLRLSRSLPVSVGDRLDVTVLRATADTLERRLRNEGFAHAEVFRGLFIPADQPLEAQVTFDVFTGPASRFGPIEVVGNEMVEEGVIRRMLPFREGDPYQRDLLFEAQRNLYNLEIFRHAAIVQDLEHSPDSLVPLEVQVNEGNSHRVRMGVGWTTAECFTTESRWSSRNFRGGARRLVLRGGLSNLGTGQLEDSVCAGAGTGVYGDLNWVLSAEFSQPFVFSPRNRFSASIFAERQALQDVFVREGLGMNVTLTRSVGRATPVSVFYRPQLARLDAAEIFFCTTFLVCDPQDIDVLQSFNRLAPVGIGVSRDRTNRAISPTGGYSAMAEFEYASRLTASNFDYERAVAEVAGFQALPWDAVLAGRIRGGWLNAGQFRGLEARTAGDRSPRIAHPQKRFFAGGANSVRGYAQNQLGPRIVSIEVEELLFPTGDRETAVCTPEAVADLSCDATPLGAGRFVPRPAGGSNLLEGNVELRFPIWSPLLRGAGFVDFGQVWGDGVGNGLSDIVVTPGFGVRYSTPVGPVRFDMAYRPARSERAPVVTSTLRPFDPDRDSPGDRIAGPDGERLEWVRQEDLALLAPRISIVDERGFSWRRIQLHFSIGQAF
jgi:outer membrane protein assembly complex protein YaeT